MSSFPSDILQHILFLLPVRDLVKSQLVCKNWQKTVWNAPATLWADYYCRFYFNSTSATLEDDKNRILKTKEKYGLDDHGNTKELAEMEATLKKKKKKKIHKNWPKRPLTAYFIFADEKREATIAANPEMKVSQISKLLASEWKSLSEEERSVYQNLAQKQKEEYNLAVAAIEKQQEEAELLRKEEASKYPELVFWRNLTVHRAEEFYTYTVLPPTAAFRDLTEVFAGAWDPASLAARSEDDFCLKMAQVDKYCSHHKRITDLKGLIPTFLERHNASLVIRECYSHTTWCKVSFVFYGATAARVSVECNYESSDVSTTCKVLVNSKTLFSSQGDQEEMKKTFIMYADLMYGVEKGLERINMLGVCQDLVYCLQACGDLFEDYDDFDEVPDDFCVFRQDPLSKDHRDEQNPDPKELAIEDEFLASCAEKSKAKEEAPKGFVFGEF